MVSKVSDNTLPKHGDTKTSVHRAWLPKVVAGVRIWLEQYEYLYVYKVESISAIIDNKKVDFEVGNWIKVSERLIKWQIVSHNG